MKKHYKLNSRKCVNSKWTAKWLSKNGEYCQCSFSCKVSVHFKRKGYGEWDYVVTEEEYREITGEV